MWIATDLSSDGLPIGLKEVPDPEPGLEPTRSTRSQAFQLLRLVGSLLGLEMAQSRLRVLGRGLQHHVYLGWFKQEPGDLERAAVARIPVPDSVSDPSDREAMLRRVRLLDALRQLPLSVQIPQTFGAVLTRYGWATVQTGLEGIQLDFLRDRSPIEAIAHAAAICHRLDPDSFARWLPPCTGHREFAREQLEIISEIQVPGASQALRWAEANLPPEAPCRLLHGDLLPQNLMVNLDLELNGILDWDYAVLGDPAYDLAIATRGSARPFGVPQGLTKLLEAYNSLVETPISRPRVQLYELCIRAHNYAAAIRQSGRKSAHARQVASEFKSLIQRIGLNWDP